MVVRALQKVCLSLVLALGGAVASAQADLAAQARALGRAHAAVVGLKAQAVEGAASARTLGPARQGSGVVIGADGLVLTIGYLVLEAEQVELLTDDNRTVPARVLAYDQATGFGLVQALVPLGLEPVPLGQATDLNRNEPLMVASGGDSGAVSMAQLVSRREFAGYWEYLIDGALFTTPPHPVHSGAGLFNPRGELVGVGSLVVNDAAGAERPRVAGNMFVPVDLLTPILAELKARGSTAQSRRAWMGLNCMEADGQVYVVRVADESPAAMAGLQRGDRILGLDGTAVSNLPTLWRTLWQGGAAERNVVLEVLREGEPLKLTVHTIDRHQTLRRPQGI